MNQCSQQARAPLNGLLGQRSAWNGKSRWAQCEVKPSNRSAAAGRGTLALAKAPVRYSESPGNTAAGICWEMRWLEQENSYILSVCFVSKWKTKTFDPSKKPFHFWKTSIRSGSGFLFLFSKTHFYSIFVWYFQFVPYRICACIVGSICSLFYYCFMCNLIKIVGFIYKSFLNRCYVGTDAPIEALSQYPWAVRNEVHLNGCHDCSLSQNTDKLIGDWIKFTQFYSNS